MESCSFCSLKVIEWTFHYFADDPSCPRAVQRIRTSRGSENLYVQRHLRCCHLDLYIEFLRRSEMEGRFSIFQMSSRDFIVFVDEGSAGYPLNLDRISINGFNFSISGKVNESFSQRLFYRYSGIKDKSGKGENVPYNPRHRLELVLDYGYNIFNGKMYITCQSRRYYKPDVEDFLRPYLTVDSEISVRMEKRVRIFLRGKNIFAVKYSQRFNYLLNHRKIIGGIKISF